MGSTKERIVWIDQLRSIAFLFVILGHVAISDDIKSWIYSFHMPLFFMISGLTVNREKLIMLPFKDYVIKQARALLVPYFWLNFLMFPLWFLTYKVYMPVETSIFETFFGIFKGSLEFNSPSNALWFLLVLFFANILYTALLKLTKGKEALLALSVAICAVFGYLDNGVAQYWHFNIALTAVAFLYIGNRFMLWYRKCRFFNEQRNASFAAKIVALIVLLGAIGWISHCSNDRISMTANKFGNSVLLFYITAIAFSAAIMLVVMFLPKVKLITYIGQNTLFYMGVHIPIIRVFERFFPEIFLQPVFAALLAFALYFAIALVTLLCSKLIPYACGKPSDGAKAPQLIFRTISVMWCLSVPLFGLLGYFGFTIRILLNALLFVFLLMSVSVGFVILTSKFCPVIYLDSKKSKKTIDKQ